MRVLSGRNHIRAVKSATHGTANGSLTEGAVTAGDWRSFAQMQFIVTSLSCEKEFQKNPLIFLELKKEILFPLNMARAKRRPF